MNNNHKSTKPGQKAQAGGFRYQSFADEKTERVDEATATDTELYNKLADNDPVRYTQIMKGRYDGTPMPPNYPREASPAQVADLKARLDNDPNRPQHSKKMSATRSWQIIKDSMSKDELEEHYKEHPKERPVKLTGFKPDPYLTEMLGDDWLL